MVLVSFARISKKVFAVSIHAYFIHVRSHSKNQNQVQKIQLFFYFLLRYISNEKASADFQVVRETIMILYNKIFL